jgi:hypothetical protein
MTDKIAYYAFSGKLLLFVNIQYLPNIKGKGMGIQGID